MLPRVAPLSSPRVIPVIQEEASLAASLATSPLLPPIHPTFRITPASGPHWSMNTSCTLHWILIPAHWSLDTDHCTQRWLLPVQGACLCVPLVRMVRPQQTWPCWTCPTPSQPSLGLSPHPWQLLRYCLVLSGQQCFYISRLVGKAAEVGPGHGWFLL